MKIRNWQILMKKTIINYTIYFRLKLKNKKLFLKIRILWIKQKFKKLLFNQNLINNRNYKNKNNKMQIFCSSILNIKYLILYLYFFILANTKQK